MGRRREKMGETRLTGQLLLLTSNLGGVGGSLSSLNLESLNLSGEFENLVL